VSSACQLQEALSQVEAQSAARAEAERQLDEVRKAQAIYIQSFADTDTWANAQRVQLEETEAKLSMAQREEQRLLEETEHLTTLAEQHRQAKEEGEKKLAQVLKELAAERQARAAFATRVEELEAAVRKQATQTACQRFQAAARGARQLHEGQDWEALERTEAELRARVEQLELEREAAERQHTGSHQSLLSHKSALTSVEMSLSKICGNMDEAVEEWLPWSDLKEVQGQLRTTQLIVHEALNNHDIF